MDTPTNPCPCGSGQALEACCLPVIQGTASASSAEALMRSRYTAFATGHIDHLARSLHPSKRGDFDRKGAEKWSRESQWQGLEVIRSDDREDGNGAEVEFIARYAQEGQNRVHHEVASFEKLDGSWYFLDGKPYAPPPFRREQPKVGRNDPCPCGSGKKHKKCCGAR